MSMHMQPLKDIEIWLKRVKKDNYNREIAR